MSSILNTVDMVISISQETINYQFSILRKRKIIKENWNIVLFDDDTSHVNQDQKGFNADIAAEGFSCAFNAQVSDPTISILPGEAKTLLFFIPFKSGTMYYWKGHGKSSTLQKADMAGWIYAFKVQIGSIEKSVASDPSLRWMITDESKDSAKDAIAGSGIDQKYFTIESLFLDLENANYADYDARDSHFTCDPSALADFQNLLSNYFKSLAGTDNPYILGYGLKVKDIPNQQEAMFQPTALKYSTTFNDNPDLSALNYLMMTGGKPFSTDLDVGVFPKSLITNPGCDGELTLSAELFCNKMFDSLDLQKIYAQSFDKIKKQATEVRSGGATVYPLVSYDGKLTRREYAMDALKQPYVYTIEGSSQGTQIATFFNEESSIVPIAKFFDKILSVKAQSITVPVWLGGLGRKDVFSKKRWEDYTFQIAAFNKDSGCSLGLGVVDYINTQQHSAQSTAKGPTKQYYGHCNTVVPQCTIYKIEAGATGKITVTLTESDATTDIVSMQYSNKKVDSVLTNFNECMKDSIKDSMKTITEVMNKLSSAKIILPCNKVYAYKDLRFEFSTEVTKVSDNTVKAGVSYETTTS